MLRADKAEVTWGGDRKSGWTVRIQVGAEVIKRHPGKNLARNADEDSVKTLAVATAKDEGYELDPAQVVIHQG